MCNCLMNQVDFPVLSPKEGAMWIRAFYGTEDPLSAQKWLTNFIHWADQHNLSTMNMLKYAVTALFGDARDWFQGLGEVATWRDFWFLFREKFLQETAIWTGTIVLVLLQTKIPVLQSVLTSYTSIRLIISNILFMVLRISMTLILHLKYLTRCPMQEPGVNHTDYILARL